jgi:hypothetical protein
MAKFVDLTGQRFGNLTVTGYERIRDSDGQSRVFWIYRCDCGNIGRAVTGNLKRIANCKKCGIAARSKKRATHHREPLRLYNIWNGMKRRCDNPDLPNYKNYGGRGISVCEEWKNSFDSFRSWAFANGYAANLSIDRIDVNGDYKPENCRWADRKTQNNNTRANHYVEYRGERKTIAEWADETGVDPNTIYPRLNKYGWSVGEALGFEARKGGE